MRVFHVSFCWWFFIGIWLTKSLQKSTGLFSVFWPISIMQHFRRSPLVILFPNPPVLVSILWWLYQEHQLQWVWQSLSCSIVFSMPKLDPGVYPSFHFLQFYSVVNRNSIIIIIPCEFFVSAFTDSLFLVLELKRRLQWE